MDLRAPHWSHPLTAGAVVLASSLLLIASAQTQGSSAPTVGRTTSFSFPSFLAGSCGAGGSLICMQNSTVRNGYIAVTPDGDNGRGDAGLLVSNIGRVLYWQPAVVWPASFTTSFTVLMLPSSNGTGFGDGMSFVMTSDRRQSPLQSSGGFLGLFNQSTEGNTTGLLAVEIDTFQNEFDPDGNHVGIDTRSIVSDATGSLNTVGVDPTTKRPVTFQIHYDGWTKNLEFCAGYAGEGPPRSVLNFTIPIARLMRSNLPVYVGFTGGTGPSVSFREDNRVLSWNFSSITLPISSLDHPRPEARRRRSIVTVLGVVLGVIVLLTLLGMLRFLVARRLKKRKRRAELKAMIRNAVNAPKLYTYDQLARATGHFSSTNLLGKGGFGSVYMARFTNPPSIIAVKKMSATSKQGQREYFAEICTIGRLRHRNLVQLQGWCHSGKSLLLVYQYMPNGSLDRLIRAGTLDWPTRHRILLGLASALLYLHEECGGPVVHRDVKPSNVLLDADFEAHLGDFGLARLLKSTDRSTCTTVVAGTIGYLAPECCYTGKATPETDVFSYGVVMLELICGRRSLLGYDDNNLLNIVWNLHTTGDLLRAVDEGLGGRFDAEQVRRALLTGLMCAHPNPGYRPRIRKVVNILDSPNEPLMEVPACRPDALAASFRMKPPDAGRVSHAMDASIILPPSCPSPVNSDSTATIS